MVGQNGGGIWKMGEKPKSQKWKDENAFYINPKTHKIQYNRKCQKCACICKQSFRSTVVACPYFTKENK